MTKLSGCFTGLAGVITAAFCLAGAAAAEGSSRAEMRRGWTANDSPQVRHFAVGPSGYLGTYGGSGTDVAKPSSDGRYFFISSRRGDLGCDCNIHELSVFAVDDVVRALSNRGARAPAPLRTVTMRAPLVGLYRASWVEGDQGSIEFVGRKEPADNTRIYRLNVVTGRLTRIEGLSPTEGVASFAARGAGVIFSVIPPEAKEDPPYPIHPVTAREVQTYLYGGALGDLAIHDYAAYGDRPAWRLKTGHAVGEAQWFSPDGRRAVMLRRPAEGAAEWSRYAGLQAGDAPASRQYTQFVWVDLEGEREEPLMCTSFDLI